MAIRYRENDRKKEARSRADQLGESARKFSIAVNTGGIAVVTAMAVRSPHLVWFRYSMLFFVLGLIVIGWNYHVAKTKELKRAGRDEAELLPQWLLCWLKKYKKCSHVLNDLDSFLWRNTVYYIISLLSFLLGALTGIFSVPSV